MPLKHKECYLAVQQRLPRDKDDDERERESKRDGTLIRHGRPLSRKLTHRTRNSFHRLVFFSGCCSVVKVNQLLVRRLEAE